jgi:hypothetical protein
MDKFWQWMEENGYSAKVGECNYIYSGGYIYPATKGI